MQFPRFAHKVCEGDRVIIDVDNRMQGIELAIHWHGVHQRGTQYYDGVPFLTQCPIPEGTTFRYQWNAEQPGTHFFHAHTGQSSVQSNFFFLKILILLHSFFHEKVLVGNAAGHFIVCESISRNKIKNKSKITLMAEQRDKICVIATWEIL
jgi:Multicopper oxidase